MYKNRVGSSVILLLIIIKTIISCADDKNVPSSRLKSINDQINKKSEDNLSMTKQLRDNYDTDDDDDSDHDNLTNGTLTDQYARITLFQ